jgi:putative transposase
MRHESSAARNRGMSEVRRVLLTDIVKEIHAASRGTYGTRRIRAALAYERGLAVNRKLVRRIMAQAGLEGLPGRKKGRRNLAQVATQGTW